MFTKKSGSLLITVILHLSLYGTTYDLKYEPIDVVMPCHKKDIDTLDACIAGIRENISNVNRIIIVSDKRLTDKAEWFDESKFPFSKWDLALEIFKGDEQKTLRFLRARKTRIGWIFKQMVNLYSALVVPGVSSNILAIDADTIFLRPVSFLNELGGGLYNPGTENHRPYFDHGARLIPGFRKVFTKYSGISHHMLFQRAILEDLHKTIIKTHGLEPWKAICRCIDHEELYSSCMADYELYFNFAFERTNQIEIRKLKWANVSGLDIQSYIANDFDYVSCHAYMR